MSVPRRFTRAARSQRARLAVLASFATVTLMTPAASAGKPGACCLDLIGTCIKTLDAIACDREGGDFQGPGSDCGFGDCDPVACCFGVDGCKVLTEIDCIKNGKTDGVWLGPGTTCGDDDDCNGDGINDACQIGDDCNDNGILDECEVEPEPAAQPADQDAPEKPLLGCEDECDESAVDDFADALHVCPGFVYEDTTAGATNDGGLSDCDGATPFFDVWYRYRPAWSGPAVFSYYGTAMPMAVEVYDGCPDAGGARVGCGTSPVTEAKLTVEAKTTYWIRLGGIGANTGPFVFEVIGPGCALSEADCNANGVPDECECIADINGDGVVDVLDVVLVMVAQGDECPCAEDVDGSGAVDGDDVTFVLKSMGECPDFDGKEKSILSERIGGGSGPTPAAGWGASAP